MTLVVQGLGVRLFSKGYTYTRTLREKMTLVGQGFGFRLFAKGCKGWEKGRWGHPNRGGLLSKGSLNPASKP